MGHVNFVSPTQDHKRMKLHVMQILVPKHNICQLMGSVLNAMNIHIHHQTVKPVFQINAVLQKSYFLMEHVLAAHNIHVPQIMVLTALLIHVLTHKLSIKMEPALIALNAKDKIKKTILLVCHISVLQGKNFWMTVPVNNAQILQSLWTMKISVASFVAKTNVTKEKYF